MPGPQRPVPTAAPTPPAPTTPAQPGAQQVVELYPIFDRVARRRAMVNSERYEQERAALGRLLQDLRRQFLHPPAEEVTDKAVTAAAHLTQEPAPEPFTPLPERHPGLAAS